MLKYIIEFLFCSAAFMAFYKLLLEGRVSHSLARNYLVVTMFVSLFIPMLELPLYPAETIYYEIPVISTRDVEAVDDSLPLAVADAYAEPRAKASETEIITFEKPTRSAIDWAAVFTRAVWVIYLLITLLNLARFVWRIYIIGKLRRHSDLTAYELYTLAVSDRVREPFSFWRTIFTNRSFSEIEHRQIISHELSHIRHHHTAERLALELLRCVAWFNPFVWLAGSALVEVHEWQADSDVLSEGYDVYEYRQLIFRQLFGYHPNMTNGLSSQTSKKRFLMMTNFKKGKFSFVRFGAILPVVAVLVFAFGAVRAESEIVIKKSEGSDVTPTPAVEVTEVAELQNVAEEPDVPSPAKNSPVTTRDDDNVSAESVIPVTLAMPKVDTVTYNRSFTKATPIPTSGDDSPFMKMTDIIYLTVDDESVTIKEGESKEKIILPLREMVKTFHYPTSILSDFITRKASTKVIEQKWASGKVWSYPVSNAVIVVDAKKGATVADVRRARDWARWAILNLRATVSARMTNVVYGRLCERDCEVLETAIPMNVVLTPQAEDILRLSPETDVIYNIADRLPRYHGKEGGAAYAEFADWLEKQFDANKDKKKELKTLVKSHGTIFAKIVIEKDGSLYIVDHTNNDLDGHLDFNDVIAGYLENMCAISPKWKPAKHNGKPVRAQFSLFIKRGKFDVGYEPPFPNLNQENADKSVPRGVVVNPKQSDRYSNYQIKIKIKKITLTDEQTVVDLYVEQWHNWWVRIESNSVLMTGDKVYPIQDVRGAVMDVKYWMPQSGKAVFQLIFPPIDCKTDKLTFGESGWRIEDIDLSELTSGVQRDNIELNNLTSKMQGGEKIPAGFYQVSGFDTKHEWTKLSGEAMKYVMDTAPRFVFEENNEVEIVSPVNNDYIKSGKYSYKLTLDKKQSKSHGYIERKGNIEFANGDNHYNYPCTIRQHEEDESSYNLQIYFNHYISDIDVDVKFILFSLFE